MPEPDDAPTTVRVLEEVELPPAPELPPTQAPTDVHIPWGTTAVVFGVAIAAAAVVALSS